MNLILNAALPLIVVLGFLGARGKYLWVTGRVVAGVLALKSLLLGIISPMLWPLAGVMQAGHTSERASTNTNPYDTRARQMRHRCIRAPQGGAAARSVLRRVPCGGAPVRHRPVVWPMVISELALGLASAGERVRRGCG